MYMYCTVTKWYVHCSIAIALLHISNLKCVLRH